MPKTSGTAIGGAVSEEEVRVTSVTSTEAQNALGELIERVGRGERFYITRYGRRRAVILSPEAYAKLVGREPVDLAELEEEFEARLRRMRTPEHQAAVDELFEMSGEELGEAAADRSEVQRAGGP